MQKADRSNTRRDCRLVRALLTVFVLCCFLPTGWAFDIPPGDAWLPEPNLSAAGDPGDDPLPARLQFSLGGRRKLTLSTFSYRGPGSLLNLRMGPGLRLTGGLDDDGGLPVLFSRTSCAPGIARDDQAQSFQADFDDGRGRLTLSLQSVGARFPQAAKSLQGVSQADLKPLLEAAGTRSLNLTGSYQLFRGAFFSTTRTSLYNDRPGDEKRGLATSDWVNALSLNLNDSASLRLALSDHTESWDPTTGKTGLSRRTTELGGESKFGADGKYSLRFNLKEVGTTTNGRAQSEQTREVHLALPVHARLRLSADYIAKEGTDGANSTNLVSAVMQLYRGAELTANLKTLTAAGKDTRETSLKFAGDLGHGSSSAKLMLERVSSHQPDNGLLTNTKLDLNGGLGTGPARLSFRATYQDKRGDGPAAPLERHTSFHLDRAFGPRFALNLDHEEKARGTVGEFQTEAKSVCGLTATLAPPTKLTAGLTSQRDGLQPFASLDRDLVLEQRLGALQLRARQLCHSNGPDGKRAHGFGVDWARGTLPDWAAGISRRHEFEDVQQYLIKPEAKWLDLPFAGTRIWSEQRTGGEDGGVRTLLFSHRTVIANRYHLQLTYHDRPEYEEGDKKGRPQSLRRHYAELGMPLGHGLVGRTWLMVEKSASDPLSQRRTVGLAVSGKLPSQAQVEVDYSRDAGSWEGRVVGRNAIAVFYSKRVDDERNLNLKLGYAWGEGVADGRDRDCRLTLALNNPL